jgi:hypothetical protein
MSWAQVGGVDEYGRHGDAPNYSTTSSLSRYGSARLPKSKLKLPFEWI